MDKQQIFDTVATHLLKQGKPALSAEGYCRYRTDDGLKCAVGVLIPDDKYDPKIEGYPVGDAGDVGAMVRQALPFSTNPNLINFLADLQFYHDNVLRTGLVKWKTAMRTMAHHEGLNTEALDG